MRKRKGRRGEEEWKEGWMDGWRKEGCRAGGGGERNKVKRVEQKNCGKGREEVALEKVETMYNSSLPYSVITHHE